jgi:hypothetical protein
MRTAVTFAATGNEILMQVYNLIQKLILVGKDNIEIKWLHA